jgi:hypothetical protein
MKTPTQKMMNWALENVQSYLDENIEKDKGLDDTFDETIKYEYEKMKEIFIAGIMLGNGAYQLKRDFDPNIEFQKTYKLMFPEE